MTEQSADTILNLLKMRGPQTAKALGVRLGMSAEGARQHLAKLRQSGLVVHADAREEVGRPKRYWRLSEAGHGRFPDSHAQLTLDLLNAMRGEFGEDGIDRLVGARERQMLSAYQSRLEGKTKLKDRISALAEVRSEEGYMAEAHEDGDGGFALIENHCPICAAATECQNFCRSELAIFQQVLGPDATVERTDHLLAGARRCAYRITPGGAPSTI
jgi:predicted ArsR family transcriptional regulator